MIFFTDLDNTIIYSYKHDIGPDTIDVELYQGRNISFVTKKTHGLLTDLRDKMLVVPVSTRTVEQYERIDLKVGAFKYALVCNGGILLEDGKRVDCWYQESLEIIDESREELNKAIQLLESDARRTFELRFIEQLFVFTKCDKPEEVVENLKKALDSRLVDVFNNGTKVYVVPQRLNKGTAVKRFMKMIASDGQGGEISEAQSISASGDKSIAAGDSEFDISMLAAADFGLAPFGFCEKFSTDICVKEMPENVIFSDALLEECLKFQENLLHAFEPH